jgi:uncharacterized protein YjbI with pentapeptide repeats
MEKSDPAKSRDELQVPPEGNPKELLDAANQSSAQVAVLHLAFVAICAYVLVVVFGTRDLDLLIGKSVRLPVVDVEVSIVGFYTLAPFLVVLVHLNLLLQLQLLSRKLYILDAAISEAIRGDGFRDRLHTFPFTYYLIGRPVPLVHRFLGVVIATTVMFLPLATLLALQFRFLAYQDSAITWAQRAAVWADIALIVALWPMIMDRDNSWHNYMREIWSSVQRRNAILRVGVWLALLVTLFAVPEVAKSSLLVAVALAVLDIVNSAVRHWRRRGDLGHDAVTEGRSAQMQGTCALVMILAIGLPLPLVFIAKGERLEMLFGESAASRSFQEFRRLNFNDQVLLAKTTTPEVVAQLRRGDVTDVAGIDLRRRSLRDAQFRSAILSGADLREAQLQDADLTDARLQRAELAGAQLQHAWFLRASLQGADFSNAQMASANLVEAQLHGANFFAAELEGADLSDAVLEGAKLEEANLRGANLFATGLESAKLAGVRLEGANLEFARLQGADLSAAQLKGSKLGNARLEAADLRDASLCAMSINPDSASLVDIRGVEWAPPADCKPEEEQKGARRLLRSCLTNEDVTAAPRCEKQWREAEMGAFRKEIHTVLAVYACRSTAIARGLLSQANKKLSSFPEERQDNTRLNDIERWEGLVDRFAASLDVRACPGLFELSEDEKQRIRRATSADGPYKASSPPPIHRRGPLRR